MDTAIASAIGLILGGCCVNVIFLELITREDKGAGNIITLAQFAFMTLEGLLRHVESWTPMPRLRSRSIPLHFYALLTAIFFFLSTVNNKALAFNISMPLHMVFRASSLVASLVVGYLFFAKRYHRSQVAGTLLVSFGITVTTLADADAKRRGRTLAAGCCDGDGAAIEAQVEEEANDEFLWWLVGVAMLAVALLSSALLGHLQEYSYRTYKRDGVAKASMSSESKFYSHAMALPFFCLAYRDIAEHAALWQQTASIEERLAELGLSEVVALLPAVARDVPALWYLLAGNVATQFVCITGVYRLTSASSTLTCTMTITLRKFVSLVISVLYFRNPFSQIHWLGTAFVFLGASVYSGIVPLPATLRSTDVDDKGKKDR